MHEINIPSYLTQLLLLVLMISCNFCNNLINVYEDNVQNFKTTEFLKKKNEYVSWN